MHRPVIGLAGPPREALKSDNHSQYQARANCHEKIGFPCRNQELDHERLFLLGFERRRLPVVWLEDRVGGYDRSLVVVLVLGSTQLAFCAKPLLNILSTDRRPREEFP